MILSALYFSPSGLFKQMFTTFSMIIWLLIILSVLIISLTLYQSQAVSHFTNRRLFKRDANLIEFIILVCSYLFNNISKTSDNFLLTIWAFTSVTLIACFCGDILSSLVNQDLTTINTFKELAQTDISIISGKWSYFDTFNNKFSGLETLKLLGNRTEFVDDYNVSRSLKRYSTLRQSFQNVWLL
jgi:hypothetical protein